jgi:signal transduction histidine kinase
MASGISTRASSESPKPPPAGGPDYDQNLQRLDQLANLGLVAASVAHEIKNGLVAINTFVELLLQKGEDQELSETVRRELRRIDMLVTQMLRFAAPKSAAAATVHVHDLLDHALRLLQHQMSGNLIALHRHYNAVPDTVRGDEAQLQQAFMNLLLNAVEAMGANGELNVATEIVAGGGGARRMELQIQDTGTGIAPETLPHLFEAFFTTKKNGTGLGLAICHRVIHEHGGDISAHSEPDKGATFNVSLPVPQ